MSPSPDTTSAPGPLGNTTPASAAYGNAVDRGDILAILMAVQGTLGELKSEVKHLTDETRTLSEAQRQLPVSISDRIGSEMQAERNRVDGKITKLDEAVSKLSHWKAAILGGAAVVSFFVACVAFIVHEVDDKYQIVPVQSNTNRQSDKTAGFGAASSGRQP